MDAVAAGPGARDPLRLLEGGGLDSRVPASRVPSRVATSRVPSRVATSRVPSQASTASRANIGVEGMSCASCAGTVRGAAEGLPGVLRCDVSVLTKAAQVSFDPEKVTLEAVVDAISAVGFGAQAACETSEHPSTFAVRLLPGVGRQELRDALAAIPGTHGLAEVNGQLRVFYFPFVVGARTVLNAVWRLAAHDPEPQPARPDPTRRKRRRLLLCLPAAVAAMVLSMQPDLLPGSACGPVVVSLAAVVLLFGGAGFHASAAGSLRHCGFTMDVLVSTATLCLFVYGSAGALHAVAVGRPREAHKFLDSLQAVAVLTEVLLLGRCIEERARQRTQAAIHEMSQARPMRASLVRADRQELEDLPIDLVQVGDFLRVEAGATIPADGTLRCDEEVQVDESLLTGESEAITKSRGSELVGGSVLVAGSALVEVTAVGSSTTLAEIIRLVESAQLTSPRVQRLADRVASFFVPAIFLIAAATFLGWIGRPLLLRGSVPFCDWQFALDRSMSVLMIACPCALGLATPTAVMVATGVAARRLGALVKSVESFEALNKVQAVVLDKTGTLTCGRPSVVASQGFDSAGRLWLQMAVAEAPSQHPLAQALVRAAREALPPDLELPDAEGWRSEVACGVECTVEGAVVRIGSEDWCGAGGELLNWAANHRRDGCVVVFAAVDGRAVAAVALRDEVHPHSSASVDYFARLGLEVWMCTGDSEATARAIAERVRIHPDRVVSKATPASKVNVVQRLQDETGAKVMMVGDGVNDAPALAAADVGIAVGAGSHLTCDAADVVLARGTVGSLVDLLRLSRATVHTIYRNFFWAFVFNVVGVPFAAGALYYPCGLVIPPMYAGIAMASSSIMVVSSSLLLRTFRASPAGP